MRNMNLHKSLAKVALFAVLGCSVPAMATGDIARVEAPAGIVIGGVEGDIAKFRAIPYAEPPLGALRWKPPQPRKAWAGELDATRPGPACIQWAQKTGPINGPAADPYTEDCLVINVTAPSVKPAQPMPVMVWIHGGGFIWGVGDFPYYEGSSFVRNGVMVVTLNYRMGSLGFFAHPALTNAAAPNEPLANYGLMDTVAALRWVKANIAAFGGDPNNVTIAGESAGSMIVNVLLTTESAQGLFQKAIMESGVDRAFGSRFKDLKTAEEAGRKAITEIGLQEPISVEQLRQIPSFYMIPSSSHLGSTHMVVDGRFIKQSSSEAIASGRAAKVPVLIGANSAENALPSPGDFVLPGSKISQDPLPAGAREAYGIADDTALRTAMAADSVPSAHAAMAGALAANGSPVYMYFYSYVPEGLRSKWTSGTPHFGEVGYVFDSARTVKGFYGESTPSDVSMAQAVNLCWVSFMKTGNPVCDRKVWPKYKAGGDLIEFGNGGISVRRAFRAKRWAWMMNHPMPRP